MTIHLYPHQLDCYRYTPIPSVYIPASIQKCSRYPEQKTIMHTHRVDTSQPSCTPQIISLPQWYTWCSVENKWRHHIPLWCHSLGIYPYPKRIHPSFSSSSMFGNVVASPLQTILLRFYITVMILSSQHSSLKKYFIMHLNLYNSNAMKSLFEFEHFCCLL